MRQERHFHVPLVLILFALSMILWSWCRFWLWSDLAVYVYFGYLIFPILFLLLILTRVSGKVRRFASLPLTGAQIILLFAITMLLVISSPAISYRYGFRLKNEIEQFITATGAPIESYNSGVNRIFYQFDGTTYRQAYHTYNLHETPREFAERLDKLLAESPEWSLDYKGREETLDKWTDEGSAICGDEGDAVIISYYARNWDWIPIEPGDIGWTYERVFARRVRIEAHYGVDQSCFDAAKSIIPN